MSSINTNLWIVVGVAALLAGISAVAATPAAPKSVPSDVSVERIAAIEELVVDRMAALKVPGVSIALTEGNTVIYAKGFGVANRSGEPMTAAIPSGLGSVSKSFTAAVVMQLVDEGAVQLDNPISDYLVELRTTVDNRTAQISVLQLLNHTSGFSTYEGNFGQADYSQRKDALSRTVSRLAGVELAAAPGMHYEYSNANYQILGLLIERLDERSYEEAVQERVLTRLGMTASFVVAPSAAGPQPAEPFRYWLNQPVYFDKPTPRTIVAQGGVAASAEDMTLYLLDLLSDSPTLMSVASRDALFQLTDLESPEGYALAWNVEHESDRSVIYHGGQNPGYEAVAGLVRYHEENGRQDLGFVVLVNASTGFTFGNIAEITDGVKNVVLGRTISESASTVAGWWQIGALIGINGLLLWLVLRWVRRLRQPMAEADASTRSLLFGVVATALLLALAVAIQFGVPRVVGMPMPGLHAFAPDAALALACTVILAVVAAVVRGLIMIRPALSASGTQ